MSAFPYERLVIGVSNAVMFASPACMSLMISFKVMIRSYAFCCADDGKAKRRKAD
jgi:hypothetical protein